MTLSDYRLKVTWALLLDMGNQLADEMDITWMLSTFVRDGCKPGYLRKGYEALEDNGGPGSCPMLRKRKE